jgi:hypothetical protein
MGIYIVITSTETLITNKTKKLSLFNEKKQIIKLNNKVTNYLYQGAIAGGTSIILVTAINKFTKKNIKVGNLVLESLAVTALNK